MYPDDNMKPTDQERIIKIESSLCKYKERDRRQQQTIRRICERVETLEAEMVEVKDGVMAAEERAEKVDSALSLLASRVHTLEVQSVPLDTEEPHSSTLYLAYEVRGSRVSFAQTKTLDGARAIAEETASARSVKVVCTTKSGKLVFTVTPDSVFTYIIDGEEF